MTERPEVTLRAAGLTDVGRARERNEDAFFTGRAVFAVADGLGGHRAGEVASGLAIEPISALERGSPAAAAETLPKAVRRANRSIHQRAQQDSALRGMGTTLTALALHDGTAYLAHVGDSRCYLVRGGAITQLSHDHTLVARMQEEGKLSAEQAESHPQRSVLTRALGAEPDVEVDEIKVSVMPGDRLVLCSDGLTTVVADDEILDMASRDHDLEVICRTMVEEANGRGGPDNITVVLIAVEGADGAGAVPQRPARRRPSIRRPRVRRRAILWAAVVIVVLAGGLAAVRTWANRSYYVGVHEGRVAVYRGLPFEVFGFRMSSVHGVTETPVGDVAEWYRPRLREGIRAPSLEEARRRAAQVPLTQAAEQRAAAKPTPAAGATPAPGATPATRASPAPTPRGSP